MELLSETIVVEILLKNKKKIFFVVSYRHPNSSAQETDLYFSSLNSILELIDHENPLGTILSGDFNARSSLFWEDDINSKEGHQLAEIALLNNLEQIISEPTHIRDDGSKSCIDLIFTNLFHAFNHVEVLPHTESQSKHLILHGKLNFTVPSAPRYKRKFWDYSKANVTELCDRISSTDWENIFNDKNANEMVSIFNEKFLLAVSDNIPNRFDTVNDNDCPWVTNAVRTAIRRNHRVYRKWVLKGRNEMARNYVREVQKETHKMIKQAKETYLQKLGSDLSNPSIGPKRFWTTFKKLVNKKKMTNIPPLLENDLLVSDIKRKCTIFNDFFSDQCTLNPTSSTIPPLQFLTEKRLSTVSSSREKVISIITKLNSNKAHGCDDISIRMLKLCAPVVAVPLDIIFRKCLSEGSFPSSWKLANVQPVHKKKSRQLKTNYRPISLLPICGKILEKIIFDELYTFLNSNELITKNQSGFRPGDSTINQLLSITTDIFETFEDFDETRALFLDISKAFDKVWHEGLIHKLKRNGVSGSLLKFFHSYLDGRKQRVVLNGNLSKWNAIQSGVPQGSVLGPLLFLIYINDLPDNLQSNVKLFADDSSLFTRVSSVHDSHQQLSDDLKKIESWAQQWKMVFNPDITKQAIEIVFTNKSIKPVHPELTFSNIPVEKSTSTKHLGLILDENLSFDAHIKEKISKAMKGISILKYLSKYVCRDVLNMCFKMYVRPHLDYGDIIYHNSRSYLMTLIEQLQYKAALVVSGCWQGTSRLKLYDELGWESLADRRWCRRLVLFYKIINNQTPEYLRRYVPSLRDVSYNLRSHRSYPNPQKRTSRYENSFFPFCISEWERLNDDIKRSPSVSLFKKKIIGFIRPLHRSTYGVKDVEGIKLLTKLRTEFSDLRSHRFHHSFNCDNPVCSCLHEEESVSHYLLRCPRFNRLRNDLLGSISLCIGNDVSILPHQHLTNLLLYGSNVFDNLRNKVILEKTLVFIHKSKRFEKLEAFSI